MQARFTATRKQLIKNMQGEGSIAYARANMPLIQACIIELKGVEEHERTFDENAGLVFLCTSLTEYRMTFDGAKLKHSLCHAIDQHDGELFAACISIYDLSLLSDNDIADLITKEAEKLAARKGAVTCHFLNSFLVVGTAGSVDRPNPTDQETPLLKVCASPGLGSVTAVTRLLAMGANPNYQVNSNSHTPLMTAVNSENLELVTLLAEAKDIELNKTIGTEYPISALTLAIKKNNPYLIGVLLENKATPNTSDVLLAIYHRDNALVFRLISANKELNLQQALLMACMVGDETIANTLIAHGADIKAKSDLRPLHALITSFFNCSSQYKTLIISKYSNMTPFECAIHFGHPALANALVKKLGTYPVHNTTDAALGNTRALAWSDVPDQDGFLPIARAAFCGHLNLVELFLRSMNPALANTPINGLPHYGPLALALENGHTHIAEFLLQSGALNLSIGENTPWEVADKLAQNYRAPASGELPIRQTLWRAAIAQDPKIKAVYKTLDRLHRNASGCFGYFGIGNLAKADKISQALNKVIVNGYKPDYLQDLTTELAAHRIFGFFGCKRTKSTQAFQNPSLVLGPTQ